MKWKLPLCSDAADVSLRIACASAMMGIALLINPLAFDTPRADSNGAKYFSGTDARSVYAVEFQAMIHRRFFNSATQ